MTYLPVVVKIFLDFIEDRITSQTIPLYKGYQTHINKWTHDTYPWTARLQKKN